MEYEAGLMGWRGSAKKGGPVETSSDRELLVGPGRWLVTTETSTYLLELDAEGQGHLVRHPGEGEGVATEAAELMR